MNVKKASLLHGTSADFPRRVEPEKAAILAFMKSKKPRWHTGAKVDDLVTGAQTNIPLNATECGRWGWTSQELYHFERYDLSLKPEFVEFVLSQIA